MVDWLVILTESYWRDEAFTVMQARESLGSLWQALKWDSSPPLYYLVLHYWMKIFGEGEIATRLLSLGFHLLTVVMSGLIIKHLTKRFWPAILGSLAVFLNPFLISYAFETRPYAMFVSWLMLAIYFFFKEKNKLAGLFLGFLGMTHNFGLFFLTSFGLATRKIKLLIFPGILWLFWLPIFWGQLRHAESGFWIGPLSPKFIIDSLELFFEGYGDIKLLSWSYALAFILIVLGMTQIVKKSQSKICFWLYLGPMLMTAGVSLVLVPLFIERYLLPALVMLIIWTSASLHGLSKTSRWWQGLVILLAGIYLTIDFLGVRQLIKKELKSPIRQAVAAVVPLVKPGEIIISETELNFLETKYYVRQLNQEIPVWVRFPKGKDKLPYYVGGEFFNNETFVRDYPMDQAGWIIKENGSYAKIGGNK